jgi:N-acetyl sugar amidotransferase
MDRSAPSIFFNNDGICNYCIAHEQRVSQTPFGRGDGQQELSQLVQALKRGARSEYDSVIGLSGGVDSSYLAYQAIKLGLRPLAVHFDNGWNSELAVKNIEHLVKRLGLDLVTYVIDWDEFRDLQRAYFKADVIDVEMVTDHAIFAAMYKIARSNGISTILSGTNAATESIMPEEWQHFKFDLVNLRGIHRVFGDRKLGRYPTVSVWKIAWYHYFGGVRSVSLLNYLPYNKTKAIKTLEDELGWRYYGGKHFESIFTKFYQAHILPVKFGVDKRRCHLSDLVMNGELTRDQALRELQLPLYGESELQQDLEYVSKKLGFTLEEMDEYLQRPPVSHFKFPSYAKIARKFVSAHKKRGR